MEKGQIFSLDFLISMVVITAAVALLIQATEFNTYNMKEKRTYNEMRNVARIASNMIIASNETTCDDSIGGHLMNCVDSGADFTPITDFLTASGYLYDIDPLDLAGESVWNTEDFVEEKRTTFIDDFSGVAEELMIRVWKA